MAAESPHWLSHQLILGEVGLNEVGLNEVGLNEVGLNEVVGEMKVREAIGAGRLREDHPEATL